jgi:regulator of protease activity HflC (stomatin/prohibitin superfamily)
MNEFSGIFSTFFGAFGIIGIIAILVLMRTFRILWEFERGVVFTLGRFRKVKGPGLILVFPIIQKMIRVDLRVIVLAVPTQEVISRDNVSLKVNAVLYFRVIDPEKSIINVEDYFEATNQLAQTTLRSVLGQHELDTILAERDKINASLQRILDDQTETWGIKVTNVEIKQVDLNESMVRAIAKQAEAERERRAKIIHAEGEYQASEKLLMAAEILAQQPQTMVLRYLQTLGHHCRGKQLHHYFSPTHRTYVYGPKHAEYYECQRREQEKGAD